MAHAGITFLHNISPERYAKYRDTRFTLAAASSALNHTRIYGDGCKSEAKRMVVDAEAVIRTQFADLKDASHFVEVYRNILDADDNVLEQRFFCAMAIKVPPILRRPEMLMHLYRMCDLRLQHEPDDFIYDIKSIGELAK